MLFKLKSPNLPQGKMVCQQRQHLAQRDLLAQLQQTVH